MEIPSYLWNIARVNRGAITLIPKQEFLDWLASEFHWKDQSIEDFKRSFPGNTYLFPEFGSDIFDNGYDYVLFNFENLFEAEMKQWNLPKSRYPKLYFDTFESFFEIHVGVHVVDVVDARLLKINFED
ncbi:MAG: hypothetical protein ACK4Q5_11305 [Saprospiraceae bacterium]